MGSCPVQIISFKDSSPNIFKEMMTSYEMPDEFEEKPRVLVFACENDALPVFDMAAINRLKINTSVRILPMSILSLLTLSLFLTLLITFLISVRWLLLNTLPKCGFTIVTTVPVSQVSLD